MDTRLFTVHGAKGLESPIVWLLDANANVNKSEGYGVLVDWPPEADAPSHFSLTSRHAEQGTSRAMLFDREELLDERENLNLLYVAMTRAKQALIVSGVAGNGGEGAWYPKIAAAALAATVTGSGLPILAPRDGAPVSSVLAADARVIEALRRPLPIGSRVDNLIDPRRRYGTLLHALLEKLAPPDVEEDREFLRDMLRVSQPEFDRLWRDAHALLGAPELARFFDPAQYVRAHSELAYVSESGDVKRIDRVVEFPDETWVLDYKTGEAFDPANLAAAARPYRPQLAEYEEAVAMLIPGKPVTSALIFAGGLLHRSAR